ncbi:hypothetical protein V6N11_028297 [Hibiscus sabdariffa]|uniref:KIB1-4 beta-propeller domain-containing protein n=1 Tax=Hibiscus sabdariffa TaxID=183260 RepID=A0ABR2NQ67_9ROSI
MKEISKSSVPDWANITNDVLRSIADKSGSVKDVVRMSVACRSWQASLVDKKINFPVCLKLAETEDSDKRCFYTLARPGDKIWTPIVGNIQVVDAIYFRVQFSPSHPHDFDRQYIFDLAGNLCVVARGIIPFVYDDGDDDDDDDDDKQYLRTVEFKIFKLDMHTKSWEEIFSLDDHSLFLGNCSTFAVDGYSGCKPNCIYFTDDIFEYYETKTGNTDTGIYDCRNIKLDIRKRYYEIEDIDEYVEGLVEDFPNPEDMQHLLLSPFFQHLWIIPYSC